MFSISIHQWNLLVTALNNHFGFHGSQKLNLQFTHPADNIYDNQAQISTSAVPLLQLAVTGIETDFYFHGCNSFSLSTVFFASSFPFPTLPYLCSVIKWPLLTISAQQHTESDCVSVIEKHNNRFLCKVGLVLSTTQCKIGRRKPLWQKLAWFI